MRQLEELKNEIEKDKTEKEKSMEIEINLLKQ